MLRTRPIALPDLAGLDAGQPRLLPIDSIDEDPEQPRKEFDEESLAELAETIRDRGVRSPVSVRSHPDDAGRWVLNFGARRLRASRLAERSDIPAFVDETFDSYDQVIENEQREPLRPLELALFIQRQLDRGQSRAQIARGIGKSPQYVTYACALIDAPAWLMDLYRSGKCRGMLELHELRKLHEANASLVAACLTDATFVRRSDLQRWKARLAGGEHPGLVNAAPQEVASSISKVHPPAQTGGDVKGPPLSGIDHNPAKLRDISPAVQRLKTGDSNQWREVTGAFMVCVRAQYAGTAVRIVLDVLPDLPLSVFVVDQNGDRTVAPIDALVRVELALDRRLPP